MIRSSRAGEVERLLAALGDEARREAAVARLRVIGTRGVERVAAFVASDAPAAARAAAVRALEGVSDGRAFEVALAALGAAETEVAAAAIGTLRGWLAGGRGAAALDAISATLLDPARDARLRQVAREALVECAPDALASLRIDLPGGEPPPFDASDAASARAWLSRHHDAPLSTLHAFITALGERQRAATGLAPAQAWRAARAAAHAVLAARGSTVALYDLKETFAAASEPLPVEFLTAVAAIGDAGCIEPLARAWEAAPPSEPWWREQLSRAADAIVHRTRLSGRSAVLKHVRARHPGFC